MPFGNGEEFFIPEVKGWIRAGHEVLIVPRSPRGRIVNNEAQPLEEVSLREGLWSKRVVACASGEILRHPIRFAKILRLLVGSVRLQSVLKNLFVVPKSLWLARTAKRWGANHIHAQWAATTATMALIAGEWSAIPWSFTAHRGDIVEGNLLCVKTARASLTRFISQTSMRMAADRGAKVTGDRARVIHMGVVLPRSISATRQDSARFEILCPASLLPVKGHEYLLHAMTLVKKQHIPFRLRLAGGGPLRSALEEMARQFSLASDVEFLGPLPHERLLELYRDRQVDVVVVPSIQLPNNEHEGIPVSLMEAMAHGVPVVSTTTGGIPELLQDGAGIMVPPQDVASLAAAVERLFRNPSLREGLAAAGKRRIESEFSVDRTVEQLAACIEAANARSQAA